MARPRLGEIRLLVSDVDGTLVHTDKSLGEPTVAAVKRLQDAGVHFTLISSRPPRAMQKHLQLLGIDLPYGAYNGGSIFSPSGELLHASRLSREAVVKTLEALKGEPVEIWLYADDLWLAQDPNGAYVPKETHTLGYGPTVVESFEPYLDRVDKIVAACGDFARLAELEKTVSAQLEQHALAVRSQRYYLDVTALSANKGEGVTMLAGHIGVPLEFTAVIGDAGNDVPMFKRAGVSIAMGQGEAAVLEQATYITDSNEDDGVATAIDKYILPAVHLAK